MLSKEEKQARAEKRKKEAWCRLHKFVDGVDHKVCNNCEKYYPATPEYFYINKVNQTDGLYPYCKTCAVIKQNKWQEENPEQYARNVKNGNANRTFENRLRTRESNKRRRLAGKDKEYQQNNRDKVRGYNKTRYRNKKHEVSDLEWFYCRYYFNNNCAYCGMSWEENYVLYKKDFHREHVDYKGANDLSNCVPSCAGCNSQKYKFDLSEWYNIHTNTKYNELRMNRIVTWLRYDYKKFYKI